MLVLTRKPGQELVIGKDITISVSRVTGNRVSLAIEAPEDVRISRAERGTNVLSGESKGRS
jgi:carbon storage regulator